MTQMVYGLARDNGDGSNSISWFRDKAIVDELLDGDDHCEEFGCNDGGPSETLEFPMILILKPLASVFPMTNIGNF